MTVARSSRIGLSFTHRAVSAAALASAIASLAPLACTASKPGVPGAKSPERQSEAEYDLARDLFFKGNPRGALDHGKQAVELNEENAKAAYFVSSIYLYFCQASDTGLEAPDCRLADAEKYVRLAMKVDDSFRDARNLLGNVLTLQGKYAEAIAVLTPLTRDPAYTETHLAWGNLGWAQVQSGALDDGIASLKNSVTQPRFCVGHYRLGYAYEKKGDLAAAEASLTTALSVDGACQNMQEAWSLRGRVRLRLGRVQDGRVDLARCRDLAAESPAGRECARLLQTAIAPSALPATWPDTRPEHASRADTQLADTQLAGVKPAPQRLGGRAPRARRVGM